MTCAVAGMAGPGAQGAAETPAGGPPWVLIDGPLWDISDEGLPYRLTVAWPARVDPVARFLWARECRWTLGTGYAVVYDDYDTGTNTIHARGCDGLLFNAARQTLWPLPVRLAGGRVSFELEVGLHYASHSLPADGTDLSFSVIPGFEWSSAPDDKRTWVAGVRWMHVSHGGLFGRNGGYDGLIIRLGRRWSR